MIPRQKAGVKLQFSQSTKNGAILHKGKALRQSLRFTAFSTSLYSDKPAACLHEPSLSGKAAKSCRNKGGFDTSSGFALLNHLPLTGKAWGARYFSSAYRGVAVSSEENFSNRAGTAVHEKRGQCGKEHTEQTPHLKNNR